MAVTPSGSSEYKRPAEAPTYYGGNTFTPLAMVPHAEEGELALIKSTFTSKWKPSDLPKSLSRKAAQSLQRGIEIARKLSKTKSTTASADVLPSNEAGIGVDQSATPSEPSQEKVSPLSTEHKK